MGGFIMFLTETNVGPKIINFDICLYMVLKEFFLWNI